MVREKDPILGFTHKNIRVYSQEYLMVLVGIFDGSGKNIRTYLTNISSCITTNIS